MSFLLTTPEEFRNATISGNFGYVCLRKTRVWKSRDYRDQYFSESSIFKMFSAHIVFSNTFGLYRVSGKLRFHAWQQQQTQQQQKFIPFFNNGHEFQK